jgi:WD40 repeat protein
MAYRKKSKWKTFAPLIVLAVIIAGIGGAVAIINAPSWSTQQGNEVACPPQNDYDVCILEHPVGGSIEVIAMFSPDGTQLATAGGSDLRLWDLSNGQALFELKAGGTLKGIGEYIVGAAGAVIRVWRITNQEIVTTIQGGRQFDQMALSSDGRLIAGSNNFEIKLWSIDGEELHLLRTGQTLVRSMIFSPDGRFLAVGRSQKGNNPSPIEIYDTESGELASTVPETEVVSLTYTPSGDRLIFSYGKKTAVWSAENWEKLSEWQGNNYDSTAITLSPDGKKLVSGTSAGVIVRDFASGETTDTLFSGGRVGAVAFSPDGSKLAVSGMTRTVRVWELP